MELENKYRCLIGAYYGISLMDEYPLKEFIMDDIKNYISDFIETNQIEGYDYKKEELDVKDNVGERVKLQDALLVLNKINGPMDLVFLIKKRLKMIDRK